MKRNATKAAAVLMTTTVVMGALCSCKYETPETTTSLAPGETTAPTIDLSDASFETTYGSQLINYLDHQYYFEGEPIPLAESNFYFIDAFSELTNYGQYYGIYPLTSEGWIDLSAAVTSDIDNDEVSGDADLYANYGEFFVVYAERMLESTYIINTLAREKGLELSADDIAEIDDIIANSVTPSAQAAGMTNDEFLQLYYGPSCTEDTFRSIVYNYKLAELYTQDFIDNYEFDEAEQEALANELYESCIDPATGELSLDLFDVYGTFSYSNYQSGEPGAYQYGKEFSVSRGTCVQAYEDWAFGEDRAEGDIEVIYAPEFGYFVIGYLGTTEIDQTAKDQLAVDAMSEEVLGIIDEGTYDFHTDTEFAAPSPVETTLPSDTSASETSGIGLTAETSENGVKTKDIIMTALAAVGGIAIIAMIVMAVSGAVKKPKAPVEEDDDEVENVQPVSDEEIEKELEELNKSEGSGEDQES